MLEIVCQKLPYSWGYNLGVTVADLRDPTTGVVTPTPVTYFQTGVRVEFVVSGSVGVFDAFNLGAFKLLVLVRCPCR